MKLTKQNFFNEIKEQFPDAMQHFEGWIDEYKKNVEWEKLFGNQQRGPFHEEIKFHDIPFEMQNGIIARFELELFNNTEGGGKETYDRVAKDYRKQLTQLFADLQNQIAKRQKKLNKIIEWIDSEIKKDEGIFRDMPISKLTKQSPLLKIKEKIKSLM